MPGGFQPAGGGGRVAAVGRETTRSADPPMSDPAGKALPERAWDQMTRAVPTSEKAEKAGAAAVQRGMNGT